MAIIEKPSPNFGSRNGAEISMLVLHYTGMRTAEEALQRLCDPQAQVSAHYVVEEDGTIYRLVKEQDCAWHAGLSYWRGHKNVNNISIGIEIVNPGHEFGYRPFPEIQMQAVTLLCKDILARHAISDGNVVGHSDVAPQRKQDPGELFNWKGLAEQGIGLWPQEAQATEASYAEALMAYGYAAPQTPEETIQLVKAFQRHFRPDMVNGQWDGECDRLLAGLLKML